MGQHDSGTEMRTLVFDRKGLLKAVLKQFKVDRQGVHGPGHWDRVRYHALMIGRATCADLLVVELFAFLHDSRRLNEDKDPEHGSRAASYAKELNGKFFQLTEDQLEKLCHSMSFHSDGGIHADATIQTCWDADRLDLGRVGKKPKAQYLSKEGAKHIDSAYRWSLQSDPHSDEDFGI